MQPSATQLPASKAGLHDIVDAMTSGFPLDLRNARRTIVETGSAHVVMLLGGDAAVRIARDEHAGSVMQRRQDLIDSIPREIGVTLPWSLGPVAQIGGISAVVTRFVPGRQCPPGEGEPAELRRLLDLVSAIEIAPLRHLMAQPLSFCGGSDWFRIQTDEVIPRLDQSLQNLALSAVKALHDLPAESPVFAHGDLAGHNVFWDRDQVCGILDWDLSSASDPATDLATLGVWHGWHKLPEIASADQVHRATIRRNTFRLQQVAFLLISGRPEKEVAAAAQRANRWLSDNLS